MSSSKRRALKPAKSDSCPPGNVAKHTGYRPTEADVAAAKEVLSKRNEHPALPAVKRGEGTKLVYDHPDQVIATCLAAVAIGCGDTRLSNGFIRQLANAATRADGKIGIAYAAAPVGQRTIRTILGEIDHATDHRRKELQHRYSF